MNLVQFKRHDADGDSCEASWSPTADALHGAHDTRAAGVADDVAGSSASASSSSTRVT